MTLSERISEIGLTTDEVAKAVGLSFRAVASYRCGWRNIPPQYAKAFAKVLKMSLEEFWDMQYKPPD